MSDYMQGDKDNAVAVPFSDDESEAAEKDDLFAEDAPDATPEQRITRKRKQEDRVRRLLSEGKQSKEEAARLREEQTQLRNELAALRDRVMQPVQAPAPPGKDRYEQALDAVYDKQTNAYTAAQAEIKAGTFNAERQKHYEKIAREVETEKSRIHTARELDARSYSTRAEQAQQKWVDKYPEVYGNPRAYQYAEAKFRQKQALLDPGAPLTNEMVDEAMEEARTQFRLGKPKAPSASERSRMSGQGSSGGGGGSREAGIQMTPELRRMAIAAYSELPEAEALKKWANTTGKRLREKKIL